VWDQATTRPSLRRLFWVHNSARLHHVGGSGAATWLENVIYSKASTVIRTPTGERRTPGYAVRTPRVGPGPPDIQSGPPRLVPDLHVCKLDPWNGIRTPLYGVRVPTGGSQGPRTVHTRALNRTQEGVRCRHVSRPRLVRTYPHTLLLLVQAETRCCRVAYSA
jgi:hypothetical protein